MAEGRTNRAIAGELFLSERAIERYVTGIFSKLDLTASPEDHRRVLAVLAYLRREYRVPAAHEHDRRLASVEQGPRADRARA